MGIREIHTYELVCDSQKHPRCQGPTTNGQHGARLTAYSLKVAHDLIRKQGWKINDGKAKGPARYICPPCRTVR